MTEEEKKKLEETVAESILPKLEEARNQGIQIGWYTCCIQMYKDTKDLHSVKAVRKYLKDYSDKMKEKLNIE